MFPNVYSYGGLSAVVGREPPPPPRRPRRPPPGRAPPPPPAVSILKRDSGQYDALPQPQEQEQQRCHVRFAESGRNVCSGVTMKEEGVMTGGESRALMPGARRYRPCIGGARTAATQNGARLPVQFSSVGKQRPVELAFENICSSVGKQRILSDISGHVRPGELLAVMGPSGSGKTTLLNVLSGRLRPDSGDILLNGDPLNKHLKRKVCYVLQEDIFFAHLTLRQTLMYTAQLRLPDTLSHAEKVRHIDHIISTLELSRCQDTRIGEYMKGGLSGGEKKRANIGCELLTNPALMLLDEPSTGLDSSATYSLIKNLKEYAMKERKTIVLTVHQPSSQVFYMFDKLLLLCNGQAAYFGHVSNVVDHFNSMGLRIQQHYNPADFIMEQLKTSEENQKKIIAAAAGMHAKSQLALDTPYSSTCSLYSSPYTADPSATSEAVQHICSCGQKFSWSEKGEADSPLVRCNNCRNTTVSELHIMIDEPGHALKLGDSAGTDEDSGTSTWSNDSHSQGSEEEYISDRWPTSFWTQFKVLTVRNFQEARPRVLSRLNLVLTVVLALLAGLVWFQAERTEESIADFQGWIFFSTNYWMLFSLFGALFAFPAQQKVVNKERASGAYRLSAYYLARMFGELPLLMVPPTLYFVISYPMMGCSSPLSFVQLLLFLLLNSVVAESVGVFFGVACMDFQVGNTVGAIFTCGTQLFGGFLSTHIPAWLGWMRYLSMVFYAYQNMQIVEFSNGASFRCAAVNSQFDRCVSGDVTHIPAEDLLGRFAGALPFWCNMAALIGFMVVFRTLGYLVLRFFRTPTH